MDISKVIELLQEMKEEGITQCRCLDDFTGTSEDLRIVKVLIDTQGAIVDSTRLQAMERTPYDKKMYEEIYDDPYWKQRYESFDLFYEFMETNRKNEVELVDNAAYVVLVGSEFAPMT